MYPVTSWHEVPLKDYTCIVDNKRLMDGIDPAFGIDLLLVVKFLDYTTTQSPPLVPTCNVYMNTRRNHTLGSKITHVAMNTTNVRPADLAPSSLWLLCSADGDFGVAETLQQRSPENRNLHVREKSWEPARVFGQRFIREERRYRRSKPKVMLKLLQVWLCDAVEQCPTVWRCSAKCYTAIALWIKWLWGRGTVANVNSFGIPELGCDGPADG
jgi:hypothetical protein